MKIIVINSHDLEIPSDEDLTNWACHSLSHLKMSTLCSINVTAMIASEMAFYNGTYRNKHEATDILSFESGRKSIVDIEEVPVSLGDILVCPEMVLKKNQSWSAIIVHGVLHLVGYDHIFDAEAEVMEYHEEQILKKINRSF